MKDFLRKRLLFSIPVIFGVVTLVFFLVRMIPGDPVDLMLGDHAQEADKIALRQALHLDLPFFEQYIIFWKDIFVGGWGTSIVYHQSVFSLIAERFPLTLLLSLSGLTLAAFLSFPMGVWAARKAGTWQDTAIMFLALLGMSLPIFVKAPLLVKFFSIDLGWLPVSGADSPAHIILPSIVMAIGLSGFLTRMIRTSVLEVLGEDYIRTARAKGLAEDKVLFRHSLKNAMIPVLTILGNVLGGLLAGAVITETLFDWPGIGKLFYSAFQSRDYPLVQGVVLWIALSYVFINLIVDVLYSIFDPRIRLDEETQK